MIRFWVAFVNRFYQTRSNTRLPPLPHPQPRGREAQFRLGALLQHSRTPSLRVPGFEDEDDDENEAPSPP